MSKIPTPQVEITKLARLTLSKSNQNRRLIFSTSILSHKKWTHQQNMIASATFASSSSALATAGGICRQTSRITCRDFILTQSTTSKHHRSIQLKVTSDSSKNEVSGDQNDEISSEADKIVDGLDFGVLCNEFECISSPAVESSARQLVRDILQLREGNRALGTYAVAVKYKDPVRTFTGRDKYKRPLWATDALEKPSVTVQEMAMQSTSVLTIKWTLRGKPKSIVGIVAGELIVKINSQFTLNQISGQVIEHEETWDLSASSPIAQAYFWTSRRLYSIIETGKDTSDFFKNFSSRFSVEKEDQEIYPDPSGDPTKFFQRDDGFQRDVYQIALLLAVVYFIVQFLKATL